MIKKWLRQWLGIPEPKIEPYIPGVISDLDEILKTSLEGGIKAVRWYDQEKKQWGMQKFTKMAWDDIKPQAVAVWDIKQFVTCPYCNWRTDVIASNLKRKTNQGRHKGKDIHIVKKTDGGSYSETRDTMMDIPTPPYFGVMMEDTDGIDEHIPCDSCGQKLQVKEVHWGYGD